MAGAIPQDNTLGSLSSILGAVPGISEAINGKTTTTSNSGISSTGLSSLLTQLLSSTNGLASVAGGQNTAGLYNSTVQQQSVNDLITREAGEVQAKGPTTSTAQVAPTINLGQTLLTGLGGIVGTHLATKGIQGLSSTLGDALGLNGTTAAGGESAGAALSGASPFTAVSSAGQAGSFALPASAGLDTGVGGTSAAVGGSTTAAGLSGGGIGAGIGGATGTGALDAATAAGIGAAAAGVGGAVGAGTAGGLAAAGSTLAGIGGGIAGDVAASTAGIAAASGVGAGAAGAAAGGGLLADAAPIAAALAWVVCTELEAVGEMDHVIYQKAAPDFISKMQLKPSAVRGYHFWAVPYTRIMRRKDWIGSLAKIIIKPLAIGRAEYIAGKWNIVGAFTFRVLEPICSLLGNTVARKSVDWKSLYRNVDSKNQGE